MKILESLRSIFGGKTFARLFLASIWSGFSMWFIGYIIQHQIATDSLRFVDTILGFLMGTIIAGILGYYFGSSQGATDTTAALVQAHPVPTTSVTTSSTVSEIKKE